MRKGGGADRLAEGVEGKETSAGRGFQRGDAPRKGPQNRLPAESIARKTPPRGDAPNLRRPKTALTRHLALPLFKH